MNFSGQAGREAERRVFLFLQGHPSSFPRKLADELERHGHEALRINLCAGDALYWCGRSATSYRGFFRNWRSFLRGFIKRKGVSDILYYGDRRPYHAVAAELARELGINAFTYEFCYLRPDWITVERDGMSGHSHFPDDPALIRKIAAHFDPPDMVRRYPYSKASELFNEVTYNLSTFFSPFLFPFYKADRYYNLLVEYISGIPGLFLEKRNHRQAQALIDNVLRDRQSYFLFPLQLQNDYQLQRNTPFRHQGEAIDIVLRSFSKAAPPDDLLIVKLHPLDNGWERWPRVVADLSRKYGVFGRVRTIQGGDLDVLIENTRGCVQINSTVGMYALQAGCPVKALGTAIYDIEGLCHHGPLDGFWTNPPVPDSALVTALVTALAGTVQVKGNFFTAEGQAAAIPQMARMLIDGRVNGAGAFVDPPPRLKRKRVTVPN